MSRKGWVCFQHTSRSTGEKVMFTAGLGKCGQSAAKELELQQMTQCHCHQPWPSGSVTFRQKGKLRQLSEKNSRLIRSGAQICVNRQKWREGLRRCTGEGGPEVGPWEEVLSSVQVGCAFCVGSICWSLLRMSTQGSVSFTEWLLPSWHQCLKTCSFSNN